MKQVIREEVASFTDAWIETSKSLDLAKGFNSVASFTDAWIETHLVTQQNCSCKSHLLQMRGLKLIVFSSHARTTASHLLQMRGLKLGFAYPKAKATSRRIFYRCVD